MTRKLCVTEEQICTNHQKEDNMKVPKVNTYPNALQYTEGATRTEIVKDPNGGEIINIIRVIDFKKILSKKKQKAYATRNKYSPMFVVIRPWSRYGLLVTSINFTSPGLQKVFRAIGLYNYHVK